VPVRAQDRFLKTAAERRGRRWSGAAGERMIIPELFAGHAAGHVTAMMPPDTVSHGPHEALTTAIKPVRRVPCGIFVAQPAAPDIAACAVIEKQRLTPFPVARHACLGASDIHPRHRLRFN
jgi:hypothetical protein